MYIFFLYTTLQNRAQNERKMYMLTKSILILFGAFAFAMQFLMVLTPDYQNGAAVSFLNYWFGW